jgi:hypothetical protein
MAAGPLASEGHVPATCDGRLDRGDRGSRPHAVADHRPARTTAPGYTRAGSNPSSATSVQPWPSCVLVVQVRRQHVQVTHRLPPTARSATPAAPRCAPGRTSRARTHLPTGAPPPPPAPARTGLPGNGQPLHPVRQHPTRQLVQYPSQIVDRTLHRVLRRRGVCVRVRGCPAANRGAGLQTPPPLP